MWCRYKSTAEFSPLILRDVPSFPSITLFNAQSLLPKFDEVKAVISLKSSSIVCITETWLNDTVDTSLVCIPGYSLSRSDRTTKRGGGTAVYVKENLNFTPVSVSNLHYRSDCCIIDVITINLLLICIYIPPNVKADNLRQIHDMLVMIVDDHLSCKPYYSYAIVGDLNQFNVGNLCNELHLSELINRPTRGNNILDHILVSGDLTDIYLPNNVDYDCPIGKADHLMITCHAVKGIPCAAFSHYRCVLDLRESHLSSLFAAAAKVDWIDIVSRAPDVDSQWNAFHSCLSNLVDAHIPKSFVLMSDHDKEWMTPLTKLLIQERWNAYRSRNWNKFNHYKIKVETEISQAKKIWANRMKRTTNGLWKLVKSVRGLNQNKDPISKLFSYGG